jgi:hypothetical protein
MQCLNRMTGYRHIRRTGFHASRGKTSAGIHRRSAIAAQLTFT